MLESDGEGGRWPLEESLIIWLLSGLILWILLGRFVLWALRLLGLWE